MEHPDPNVAVDMCITDALCPAWLGVVNEDFHPPLDADALRRYALPPDDSNNDVSGIHMYRAVTAA